jgi:hypothetical protein
MDKVLYIRIPVCITDTESVQQSIKHFLGFLVAKSKK